MRLQVDAMQPMRVPSTPVATPPLTVVAEPRPDSQDTLDLPPPVDTRSVAQKAKAIERYCRWPRSDADMKQALAIVLGTKGAELDALLRARVGRGNVAERLLDVVENPAQRATLAKHLQTFNAFPLYARFPGLAYSMPREALTHRPTPVQPLRNAGMQTGGNAKLWVKRDDLSAQVYGGNKARKMEFTMPKILARRPGEIITGGGAGSNMTVATAQIAKAYGIPVTTVHFDQQNSKQVQDNLKLDKYYGAEMHHTSNKVFWVLSLAWQYISGFVSAVFTSKRRPYLLMPGDSNPLSTLGYVNAAFELKQQIREGKAVEPDFVYVAAGSCGTAAGLAAGFKLAGMKTKVVCVKVAAAPFCSAAEVISLANDTLDLLAKKSFSAPAARLTENDIRFVTSYYGSGYGDTTAKGEAAIKAAAKDGLTLDATYTGKAMAALLDFAKTPAAKGKNIMFWNTLNSRDMSAQIAAVKASDLPSGFANYFR